LAREGKLTAAIAEYRQALKINPELAGAYNNLGTALVREGKLAAAITEFQQALKIDPNDAQAEHNLRYVLGRH
jgi:Flp pilus assembly protein TadD